MGKHSTQLTFNKSSPVGFFNHVIEVLGKHKGYLKCICYNSLEVAALYSNDNKACFYFSVSFCSLWIMQLVIVHIQSNTRVSSKKSKDKISPILKSKIDTRNCSTSELIQSNGPNNLCLVISCNLVAKIKSFQKRNDKIIKTSD